MIFLAATALGTGVIAALALAPISSLAAVVVTPLVASLATVLAGAVLAHRRTTYEAAIVELDVQTDAMVAALKGVADHADPSSPTSARGRGVAA